MMMYFKFILFSFVLIDILDAKQTICLNMIVKNESQIIERCLESVKPIIDYWVIIDTGSEDGTQDMIKNTLKTIPGQLIERPWVDFSHNRNEALKFAKNKGDYLLIIDADEVLEFSSNFKLPNLDKDYYFVKTDLDGTCYYRVQLINDHKKWKWKGVVHEVLISPDSKTYASLEGVTNVARPDGSRSKDPKKFEKDIVLLEASLQKEPKNYRTLFYLAQSYRDAGFPEKALETYEKRVKLKGWDEEVFWSLYQVAKLKERLNYPEEEVIQSYLTAHEFRPSRAEPLYWLAVHYRFSNHYEKAVDIAKKGLALSKPNDRLFVEEWVYTYGLLMEYSVSSYWEKMYVESLLATQLILKTRNLPDSYLVHALKNLQWIREKLK